MKAICISQEENKVISYRHLYMSDRVAFCSQWAVTNEKAAMNSSHINLAHGPGATFQGEDSD
jgi:hypothetical protein